MTAVVEMASIPPWRQNILEKKRRGEEVDRESQPTSDSSNRKADFLAKTQISENTFFYSHSGSSSSRDLNRNEGRTVGKSVLARPLQSDVDVLVYSDTCTRSEWNIPTKTDSKITVNNMVNHPTYSQENSNGLLVSPNGVINGPLVDEERIGSVHNNPFVKTFGLKNVTKPDYVRVNSTGSFSSEGTGSSMGVTRLSGSDAIDMPEMEQEYKPGSGFVHKLLDKFALLRAKEEALHPIFNHHLPKRSSSLENLIDNDSTKMPNSQRISVGDEVFTTSPRSNLQYYSKAKSVENLSNKIYSERSSTGGPEILDNRRRAGSDGRHRSAPDANLGREDIIIIDSTPSTRQNDEDRVSSRRRRTSSSERQLEHDELPKPNTVSSYRKKFESARIEKNEISKQRKKKDKAANVSQSSSTVSVSNRLSSNGAKNKPMDNLPDVVKVNGESSRDSSFDLQNDISADSSVDNNIEDRDYENPVYDAIRASLRHVKPKTEEEITYSWKSSSLSDHQTPNSGSMITSSSVTVPVNSLNQNKDLTDAVQPISTTTSVTINNPSKVPTVLSHKSGSKDNISDYQTRNGETSKVENKPTEKKPTVPLRTKISESSKPVSVNQGNNNLNAPRPMSAENTTATSITVKDSLKSDESISSVTSTARTTTSFNTPPTKPTDLSLSSSSSVSSSASNSLRSSVTSTSGISKSATTYSSGSVTTKSAAPPRPSTKAPAPSVPMVQVGPGKSKIVNVGPQSSNLESNRSRNRFGDDNKDDQNYVQAGKTWFYEAGKFKANQEGVKRPSNSRPNNPVPKKRTSLNSSADSTDSSITPRSNIDDYINNSDDIPVTNFDGSTEVGSAHGAVPRLDLSSITESKTSSSPQRASPSSKKIQPCDYQFSGAYVVVGKSLINNRKRGKKLKLNFDDSLNSTYEYPCEELMLEEYLTQHPEEKPMVFKLSDYIADAEESSDDVEFIPEETEMSSSSLKSTPGLGNASGGLSSYRSKNQIEYQFGMEFERQAEREREEQQRQELRIQENSVDDGDLIPADEEELAGFSTSGISDILF